MVEDHQLGLVYRQGLADFLELARPHETSGVGSLPRAGHEGCGFGTRRPHQLVELTGIFALLLVLKVDMDEYRRFTGVGTFKKQSIPHEISALRLRSGILGRQTHIA